MKNVFCNKLAACLCMKSHVHTDEEQIYLADKEDEMRKHWMLAAAVLDRICAIAFTIIFTGGTLIFVILFITRP